MGSRKPPQSTLVAPGRQGQAAHRTARPRQRRSQAERSFAVDVLGGYLLVPWHLWE